MNCYAWIRAEAALVRNRLIATTIQAFDEEPAMQMSEKRLLREQRRAAQAATKITIKQAIEAWSI